MKKIYLLCLMALCSFAMQAQTVLISPTGDGGFETGATVAANNWTAVNASTDSWVIGSTPVVSAGTNCAFISSGAGAWTYSQLSVWEHLYKDVTIPAGQTKLALSFKWKATGEGTTTSDWDNLKIYFAPTSVVPVSSATVPATYQVSGPGAISGMYKLSSAAYNSETISFVGIPGVTYRLIFSWKSDGSTIGNPPAALDEISLVSSAPTSVSSTALGGLWSSAATWVGGTVPAGDDVTIADGAIVTVDQVAAVRNLTVGGGTSGILQWNATANALSAIGNVLVSPNANLNLFTAAASPSGTTINVAGNFTNNGTVHAGYTSSFINFTDGGNPVLGGAGTFVGGIIHQLFFQTTGSSSISTTQNIITRGFAHTAGALNTNGKLTIDNTAQIFGQPFNQKVYEIVVTAMGSAYNSATPPTVTIAAPTAGVTATATPVIDDVTGTLRSILITNAGDGYRSNPVVTITGGTGTGATATAVVNTLCIGATASSTQKSGIATITGGINIKSDQAVGSVSTTAGGAGYTTAPSIGFALPFGFLNLVTNGGAGYTTAPTVTVSGGTSLTGSTNPTFTVVVAQGKIVSVIAATGGTLWTAIPTLTITGGGGAGATCEFPAGCLATATAYINNGAVNNFIVNNAGFGYTAAPTVGLVGGGFTTAATTPTSRVGLYNLTFGYFSPAASNAIHTETGVVPANRRINILTINSALGASFTGDVEVYSSAPLVLTAGNINMGSSTLFASHTTYTGATGSTTASVSGSIKLSTPGGSLTRTFPFDASFVAVTGTGSLATGSTITTITVSQAGAPSGTVNSAGSPRGSRAYKVVTNSGAVYGTTPTVTLNFNATDGLVSDNASLYIGQSTSLIGPWDIRSASSGTGLIGATGTRTTATVAPGPIVPTGNDYYAWVSTFTAISSVSSGDWNTGATWSTGTVPTCTDNVIISNTHNVTVTTGGNVSKSVAVASGGALTVNSGDVTIGCTLNNNPLSINGSLIVNGGTLNVNGNISIVSGAKFTQTGGNINVDGNAGGVLANSVALGTSIVNLAVAAAADITLTGGTLTIVDPHAADASTTFNTSYAVVGAIPVGTGHTLRIGDGVSTDNGGSYGFEIYGWASSGFMTYGNVIAEAVTGGTNRFVNLRSTYHNLTVNGNLTINNGAEVRQAATVVTGNLIVAGNITVNAGGKLTSLNGVVAGTAVPLTSTTISFLPSTIAQVFGGAGTWQNLTTAATANLTGLTINNTSTAGVTLATPLNISGTLTMTAGVVNTTASNLLTLGYNATNAGTLTYTAGRINGPLKAWKTAATGSLTFPVGDATTLESAVVNFTAAPTAGGTLTARWIPGAPGFPNATPLVEPVGPLVVNATAPVGQWQIDAADGLTGGTYTGTFRPIGAATVLDYTKLVLVKRPSAGGDWTLDGTHVVTSGTNTAPVLSRTGMTGFSQFAIGGENNVALPITVQYFTGAKTNGANNLNWKVNCYSTPSVTLVLERSSDGRNYSGINSIFATALRCDQPFAYSDVQPLAGMNYYRLKMVDADGKISYSAVVVLINKDKGLEIVSISPNPVAVNGVLNLNVTAAQAAKLNVVIVDMQGRIVAQQVLSVANGFNSLPVNVAKLNSGTYQVYGISSEGKTKVLGFVKQ